MAAPPDDTQPAYATSELPNNLCAHCGEPYGPGDQVLAYITPNATKTGNTVHIVLHMACAEAFRKGITGGVQ